MSSQKSSASWLYDSIDKTRPVGNCREDEEL